MYYCILTGEPSQVNIELKNKLKDLFPRVPKKMLDNVIPERAGCNIYPSIYPSIYLSIHPSVCLLYHL